jgi:hypothetical protein
MAIYVDDIVAISNNKTYLEHVLQVLQSEFRIKYTWNPIKFLGVEIKRDCEKKRMFLHQSEFIDQILSRFGMEKCNPKRTLMESKLQIQSEENKLSTEFCLLIGALLFVACNTRPDVSYAVNYLSRFQSKFSDQVMSYGMRILRYLAGTRKYGINYENSSNEPLEAYVDASFILIVIRN